MDTFTYLWDELVQRIGASSTVLVTSVFGALVWIVARWLLVLGQRFICFLRSRQRTIKALGRDIDADGAREGRGVWLTRPIHHPTNFQANIASPKVLAIANLKGGVGKTTLTANLGAYYARDRGLRVLLIDRDFQGSLSSMAFPTEDWLPPEGENSIATQLVSNDVSPNLVPSLAREVRLGDNTRGKLKVVTAHYDLAQADNRIMVEWLLRCRRRVPKTIREMMSDLLVGKLDRSEDVRYTLSEILHSAPVASALKKIWSRHQALLSTQAKARATGGRSAA